MSDPVVRDQSDFRFDAIEDAIEEIRNGRLVIVVDDEDRENEGDFVGASELITPELVNFMATHGRGLICASITKERAAELELEMMVSDRNTSLYDTPFTVSVDYRRGTTTGISAADRAKTIRALVDPSSEPGEFARPRSEARRVGKARNVGCSGMANASYTGC